MLARDMSRLRVLVLPLVAACAVWTATSAGANANEQIRLAALAPYEALAQRDAAALCAAFTPSVAARLVVNAPYGSSCPAEVARLFAAAPRGLVTARRETSRRALDGDAAEQPRQSSHRGPALPQRQHRLDRAAAQRRCLENRHASATGPLRGMHHRHRRERQRCAAGCLTPRGGHLPAKLTPPAVRRRPPHAGVGVAG